MNNKLSHRQMFPEQYSHELCGKRVRTKGREIAFQGIVHRVIDVPAIGQIAHLSNTGSMAFDVSELEVIENVKQYIVLPDDPDNPEIITLTPEQAIYFETEGWIVRTASNLFESIEQVLYDLPGLDFEEFKQRITKPPFNTM